MIAKWQNDNVKIIEEYIYMANMLKGSLMCFENYLNKPCGTKIQLIFKNITFVTFQIFIRGLF